MVELYRKWSLLVAAKTYANIDENNIVLDIKTTEEVLSDDWIVVPSNTENRWDYAGIGDIYFSDTKKFKPPQPYASWAFSEANYKWEAPITRPDDNKRYSWDESAYQGDNTKGWTEQ